MNLYRRRTLQASLVLAGFLAVGAGVTAMGQRRKPHKLRATALVELTTGHTGATTARLVPITILDDGSFHDASVYKTTPEPMALGGGVVYEAQKTGQIMGYVTVDRAGKDRSGNWTGEGKWKAADSKPKDQPTVSAPTGSVDERPILHRGGSSGSATPAASPTPGPKGESSPSSTPPPSGDRPVLHRSSNEPPPQSTPSPSPTPEPSPASTPEATEASEDPNRPTLRHRTPQQARQDPNVLPTPTQPASNPMTAPAPKASAPAGPSPSAQTLVAVSDNQASESRSYEFAWKAGEKEAVETKMRRLAVDQLPHGSSGAPASLSNVVIRGFDLDLSNEPVLVLTAELPHGSAPAAKPEAKPGTKAATAPKNPPAAAAPAPSSQATRYITLIARLDFEGNPQKLAASVTDASRLDVAPRLELIDAVDVDGDGLAELLFRQYSFDEKSFVIFSIGRSTVTKLFEGASQPLK